MRRGSTSDAVVFWDGLIFSVVTVVNGVAELCLAPGCRVRPNQCGHVEAAAAEVVRCDQLPDPGARADELDDVAELSAALEQALMHADQDVDNAIVSDGNSADEDPVAATDNNRFAVGEVAAGPLPPPPGSMPPGGANDPSAAPIAAAQGRVPLERVEVTGHDKLKLSNPAPRNFQACHAEVAMCRKWTYTAELAAKKDSRPAHAAIPIGAVDRSEAFDVSVVLHEPECPECHGPAPTDLNKILGDEAILTTASRSAAPISVLVGSWTCVSCKLAVMFDGVKCGLFVLPEVDSRNRL